MDNSMDTTIEEILCDHPNLPQKLLVRFALFCVNDVNRFVQYKSSFKALEAIELWLEDKISKEEIDNIQTLCVQSDTLADAAVDCALRTIVHNRIPNLYAYEAASYASDALGVSEMVYRDKLLEMIDELTDLEKLIYSK